jgi:hypothetical protein
MLDKNCTGLYNFFFVFGDKCAAKFKCTEIHNSTVKLLIELHAVEGSFGCVQATWS